MGTGFSGGLTGVRQFLQNASPGLSGFPHAVQNVSGFETGAGTGAGAGAGTGEAGCFISENMVPHLGQHLLPFLEGIGVPHTVQNKGFSDGGAEGVLPVADEPEDAPFLSISEIIMPHLGQHLAFFLSGSGAPHPVQCVILGKSDTGGIAGTGFTSGTGAEG